MPSPWAPTAATVTTPITPYEKRGATTSAPSAIPAPHTAIRIPKPASPMCRSSVAKNSAAAGVAVISSSERNTIPTTGASSRSRARKSIPSRMRSRAAWACGAHSIRIAAATSASTRNVPPLASSANVVPPVAASTPPTAGPAMKPA